MDFCYTFHLMLGGKEVGDRWRWRWFPQ